ncbi:MAG: ATP-binding protein [Humibacillus sp.]|nr:ATP-binding protein [Humibacillus sp.]MDN5780109.1 ATP-binding protein [Humibacillus sp.]
MRHLITDLSGHLAWTRAGVTVATWRITAPPSYGLRPMKDKRLVKDLHRILVRGLSGEAVLSGHAVAMDPVAIVERQIEGINLDLCPDVAIEAEANLDRLADLEPGERVFYLSVPLPNTGNHRWSAPLKAAMGEVKDTVGYPRAHPRELEIESRLNQAARVQSLIPGLFRARPITVAEQLWLNGHAQRRGMLDFPPPSAGGLEEAVAQLTAGAAISSAVLDEGAKSDLTGRAARFNPMARRVLKVTDPRGIDLGQPSSYQALLAIADTPPGGLVWPGSELLAHLDTWSADVDWTIRLRINAREKVMSANRRAIREMNDQYQQREAEATTGQHELDHARELMTDYQQIFANDRGEVEVEHTILLAVGGSSAQDVDERACALAQTLASYDFKVERPVGQQIRLWEQMQPWAPTNSITREFRQITSSDQFAKLVPFTSTRIGGRRGATFLLNRSTSRRSIVHLNPAGYPEIDKSGSVMAVGELGGGKTVFLKLVTTTVVDEGGQGMAIDKSNDGEWARLAKTLSPDPVICDPDQPRYSSDPLRALPGEVGEQALLSFLTLLLNISAQEDQIGRTLAQAIKARYRTRFHLHGSGALVAHLQSADCQLPDAADLGERLERWASSDLGRLVFDDTLPAIDTSASNIVWRTHRMEQPSERDLSQPHLFRALPPEKIFARAYYALIVAIARHIAFADPARPAVLVCDEAYDIFSNPECAKHLEHFVRQGRRPKALLAIGSHDPDNDFGSTTLRGLIPTRIVMRQTDDALARASIKCLDIDEDDPSFEELVEELMTNTSPVDPADPDSGVPEHRRGECFVRDAFGGVASAQVIGPARLDRRAAVFSTPPKSASALLTGSL